MAESLLQDWLADYERVQASNELAAFAAVLENQLEITEAIYTILSERQNNEPLVHQICQQLLSFYRSTEESLRKFPLQFIPVLIYTYLHAVAAYDKKSARNVETLLICIYNFEISNDDGGQRIVAFRMPILAHASVYHEEKNLPMTDLRRWEENCNREVQWGPHSQLEAIRSQNRLDVMTALLFCYNQHLSQMQKPSLLYLCSVASQLVNQGFSKQTGLSHRISYGISSDTAIGMLIPKPTSPRILLNSAFLIELVHAIYFAMFNGFGTVAIQTLEDIHHRACFEMFTELILVTSAVKNSLYANPSGQPSDGPMGLSVALTPATKTVTTSVSKSMITNASFRTKKLPDDIPIQVQDLTMQQVPLPLPIVTEEVDQSSIKDQQPSRNSIIRPSMEGIKQSAHKALIAGFKKSKDKEKDKDKDKDKDSKTGYAVSNSNEPPKAPLRKFEKHNQRNSLLQLQAESNTMSLVTDFEKSSAPVEMKTKAYDMIESNEMVTMPTNSNYGIGIDSNGTAITGTLLDNAGPTNTNSFTSIDLITNSCYPSIEYSPKAISGQTDIG